MFEFDWLNSQSDSTTLISVQDQDVEILILGRLVHKNRQYNRMFLS